MRRTIVLSVNAIFGPHERRGTWGQSVLELKSKQAGQAISVGGSEAKCGEDFRGRRLAVSLSGFGLSPSRPSFSMRQPASLNGCVR